MPTVTSGNITLIDLTDTKKIDVHIASNHPTVQIDNNGIYTPDWSKNNLKLVATVYADSTPVTKSSTFQWKEITGVYPNESVRLLESTNNELTITSNSLSNAPMVRYKCEVVYNTEPFSNEITFTRISNGVSAPTVQARYSKDGNKTNMEVALDPTIHKYVHFSYDGGFNWTEGIKISGEKGKDGQSILLKGTAYTNDELVVGGVVELYLDEGKQSRIEGGEPGDSYLVDGYLCVYNGSQFICTGQLQGPKGEDGATYYLYIRYANNASGSDFSDTPGSRKYIGFYRTTATSLPSNIDKSSATWNWAKFAGEDAKSITLTGDAQVFKINKENVISPSKIKLTAQTENTSVTSWSYNTDGSMYFTDFTSSNPPAGVSLDNNVVIITGSDITKNSITIKASDNNGHSDVFTVYKVSDGSDGKPGDEGKPAPIVFLTNENITFAANVNGQVAGTTMHCNVVAYNGTTPITPTIGAISSAKIPSGMTIIPNKGTAYSNVVPTADNLTVADLYVSNDLTTKIDKTKLANGDSFIVGEYLYTYNTTNSNFKCETITTNGIEQPSKRVINNTIMLTIAIANNTTFGTAQNANDIIDIPIVSPIETTLQLTWSKINSGAKGDNAPPVKAQYSVDGKSDWTYDLNVSEHKYVRLSYDNEKTWSAAMKIVGDDAKSIVLTANAQVFKVDKSHTITPATITVTAQAINTTISTNGWTYSTDGGKTFTTTVPTGVVRNGNIVTIDGSKLVSNSVVIKASDGTHSDTLTVYKSLDGIDAPMALLTNENITFSANAQGQISGTTITSNVVGYNGTTKVTPTLGTITGMPTGMTITPSVVGNEVKLTIVIANNSTLGSALSNMGVINIPVTSPVNTTLYLTWSKVNTGATGASIKSTTVWYGVSDSASTRPIDSSWQSTIPVVDEGKYLWTRTIIDYTDDAIPDTVTYTYAKQGSTGTMGPTGSDGTSITVKSIKYQSGTSATTAPTGTWSDGVVAVAEGNYLWTQTTFSDNKVAYGVAKQGQKGDTGRGISKITEYYLATADSSGVTTSTSGWTTTIQNVTSTKKYLWNYEIVTYTDGATSPTTPVIIGVFGNTGNTGKGIKSVTEYYLATSSSSGVTTSTSGWKDTMQTLTPANKYLWNYELITYTDNSTATISPVIIGVYGDQGIQGPKGNDAYTVMLTNESHIFAGDVSNAIAGSTTTQVLAYNGSIAQTVTIVSVNGKTASTTDTDTGIAGLKFKCSALSGASPTITFTCTTSFVSKSGTIPIVLSVGGVSFTKIFTYSIAFKGTTGSPGNPGSPGTPASLVDITPSALYFKSTTGKGGTFTPDYIYLYPRFQTVTFSKWEYSINGGTTWVAASGANGLSIGTYNSVANTLRIAKTSTLYTDTVTSISFRCVSSNASVYDTVSVAKIYDVVDLQIEGRNLLLNSGIPVTNSAYNIKTYELTTIPIVGETYTLTLKGKLGEGKSHFAAYNSGGNVTLASLARVGTSDLYTKTFTWTNGGRTDLDKSVFIYAMANTTVAESTIEWIKLEKGTLTTDWIPAPEDYKSITFQLYAPKGYLITNDVPEVTLQTFAYDGGQVITGATFAWYSWNGEVWSVIGGATGVSLALNKNTVLKSSVYKCIMTYKGKTYEATATVEDKTDTYDSLINVVAKYSPTNRLYWVLSSTVYSEEGEKDELLGPVSVTAPTNPTTGSYWYKIDETNYNVTLMKYSGSAWVTTTDSQELVYDWFLFKDIDDIITLGAQSKVKIVTSNDFSRVCSVQCNVSDSDLIPLTHNNQILNDSSDPVVSSTEPTNPINGQLWIKTGVNGVYTLLVWDASLGQWIVSEADSQVKIHINKPTSYEVGDVWVVGSDYEPTRYVNGVAQTTKYLAGTMLKAQYSSQTYKDSDWVEALNYKKEIDKLQENLNVYNQYFTFDETGMTMRAKNLSGQISEFSTKLTNNELGFYQGDNKVAYINNNQLNISKAEITNGMTISGVSPILEIGNFAIIQESNGSLSIGLKS